MEIVNHEKAKVISLPERMDSLTSREIENALQAAIAPGAANLICDCTRTKYVSSAGLRVFLSLSKQLKKADCQLLIACPSTSYAYEVLETAGFTSIIPVFATVAEGLAHLG